MSSPQELAAAATDVRRMLAKVNVPSYVLDRDGTIRWLNDAAIELVGDARGQRFTSVVAPEHSRRAQQEFARKLLGADVTDFHATLLRPDGTRVELEFSSVPLRRGDHVVGVFGVAHPPGPPPAVGRAPKELTPRQHEVLRLLASGESTDDIAAQLGIARETVRNHVRGVLRALGVSSRLEAVAAARRLGAV
jgi:PAS domain S-box-containing protein